MPFATINGIEMHYMQVGKGPNLVMIHGLGGNLAVWHFTMVGKLRDHFRITTYDLRGHGRSSLPPAGYTTRDMAQDLLGLMDELEIERAHLWGHSFGADSLLHFALLYPERVNRLVVIDAMLPAMLETYQRDDWEGWSYWGEMLEKVAGIRVEPEKWRDVRFMMKHSLEVPVLFGPFRGRKRNRVPITRILTETTVVEDFEIVHELTIENLSKITAETMLIYEDRSPFMETYDVLCQRMPHVTGRLLPSSELRHFSPLEQPELILERAAPFLLSADGSGPLREEP